MRVPLSWIREFTPVEAPPADIADALNQLGLEVEQIDEPGREIEGVVVARIVDVVPHPDADRIRLADVDFGDGQVRVVCGAPNIYAGMVAPFAPVGAVLPGDFRIERRKIRGVVSEGMLASPRELGLGDDHSGILELPSDAPIGTDFREVLGLDDVVLHLAITPNRPDAMGITGVAREIATAFGLPYTVPEVEPDNVVDTIGDVEVVVEAPDRCPRFVALVANVTMGPSPAWMQRRLRLAGMRSISNVVDVTNYVMLERCRPLHAFDLERLRGRGIVVRLAEAGEKMVTLDDVTRTFTAEDLLVCDAERRPQGIAGIMGGAEAEVAEDTTEILLEAAYFEPSGVARTAKRLGIRSEASARFERGIDPNGTATGATRAMELFGQVAVATPSPHAIDVYPKPILPARITVRTARVNKLLGTGLPTDEMRALISPLGIDTEGDGDTFEAIAPTFRPDLEREIDIVEEVARRVGLQHIARTVPSNPEKVGALTPSQRERRALADVVVGAGYDETYALPLVAPSDLAAAGFATDVAVEVQNPLRAEESLLRTALLPGLLRAVALNASHGAPDVALFEIGSVFLRPTGNEILPEESTHLAAARAGRIGRMPHEPDRDVAPHDIVAVVRAIAEELRLADWELRATADAPGLHPVRTAELQVDGRRAGVVGEVARDVVAALGLPSPVVAFELDVSALGTATRQPRAYRPVSRFPPAVVDLAFVVDESVPAGDVLATLRAAAADVAERIELFDVFRSDALGAGRVSLAFAVSFRSPDRTLTDEEVATLRQRLIDAVVSTHRAELRA
jgi:phenylalanyl-tRNA synthetase beta chain